MEKKLEDILTRNVIEFATSPYQRIYFSIKNYESKTVNNIRIDPTPSSEGRIIQSISILNQPKSDISQLAISSSNLRKEKESDEIEQSKKDCAILIEAPSLSPKEFAPKFEPSYVEFTIPEKYWEQHEFIHLENWFLIPIIAKSEINVALFGYRLDIKETWCTDIIMHSISSCQIVTNSNTHYKLIGKINPEQTSNYLTKYFDEGFPINWKEIIRNEFEGR